MRNLVYVLIITLCCTSCQAQKESKSAQKQFNVSDFHGIDASTGIAVEVTKGNDFQVIAKVNREEALDKLDVSVSQGILKLGLKSGSFRNLNIQFFITMPYVDNIDISSGSSLKLMSEFSSETMEIDISSGSSCKGDINVGKELNIDLSSGSTLKLNLNADQIIADVSSGSSLRLEGNADRAEFDASSGSSINANNLRLNEVEAEANGGSSINLPEVDKVQAHADISSSIH